MIVLLTPRETAEHLRCSERKLERHRLVGDGPPFVKIGTAIRYPLSELEKWLAERTQRSTSETP
jgi:predicted DNA-binding transcriptional regulator AlpA